MNHERWLVTYADMITLLMVLFIVLFAISQVDQKKFAALKDGPRDGFGSRARPSVTVAAGSTSRPTPARCRRRSTEIGMVDPERAEARPRSRSRKAVAEASGHAPTTTSRPPRPRSTHLEDVRDRIAAALAEERAWRTPSGSDIDERGLVRRRSSPTTCSSRRASAELTPGPDRRARRRRADRWRSVPQQTLGRGPRQPPPGRPERVPQQLGAVRCPAPGSVVRYLVTAEELQPARLSATGYSDAAAAGPRLRPPRAAREPPRGRPRAVRSAPPEQVRALLPTLDATGQSTRPLPTDNDPLPLDRHGASDDPPPR